MDTSQQNTRLTIGFVIAVALVALAGWGGYTLGLIKSSPAQTTEPQLVIKTLMGSITALTGTTLTLQPTAADIRVASTSRQVLTDTSTNFRRVIAKSQESYQNELDAFLKKLKTTPPATATSSPFSGYPSPVLYENISLSDLRVGDTIAVSAASNILTAPQFKAVQVVHQSSTNTSP